MATYSEYLAERITTRLAALPAHCTCCEHAENRQVVITNTINDFLREFQLKFDYIDEREG